ncbi:NAD(P)/FAD-dependent oxidoreductase [Sinomonas sp. RB5]
MSGVVIIGGGHAGIQVADSLRSEGFQGPITIFSDEEHLPYQRPPLSKDFMGDVTAAAPLPLRAARFFAEKDITLQTGTRVTAIDPAERTVSIESGSAVSYSSLVLATGARNRELAVEGADLAGVHYLRTLDDASALQAELGRARRVVVIGAGFIGLEFATAARQRGTDVTVLEMGPRPMARVLSVPMSDFFTRTHEHSGIRFRFGAGVSRLRGRDGRVEGVVGSDGCNYPADVVLVGIGVIPNTELAAEAGLDVGNGITVDGRLQTSDPHIYAIGDCANYPNLHAGSTLRLESVQNAVDHAKSLAKTIAGSPTAYTELPWFWSQQGPVRLQIAGIIRSSDETVVRGDIGTGKFSIYCFREEKLVGVESVNNPSDHVAARKLLEHGIGLTPTQAADLEFDVRAHSRRELQATASST